MVDLLGPPPKSVISWERQHFRDLVEPKWREEEERREAKGAAAAGGADAAVEAAAALVGEAAAAAVLAAEAAAKQAILDVSCGIWMISRVTLLLNLCCDLRLVALLKLQRSNSGPCAGFVT